MAEVFDLCAVMRLLKCILGLLLGIQVANLVANIVGQLQVHTKDYPSIA